MDMLNTPISVYKDGYSSLRVDKNSITLNLLKINSGSTDNADSTMMHRHAIR